MSVHNVIEGHHSAFCQAMKESPQNLEKARRAITNVGDILRNERDRLQAQIRRWLDLHRGLEQLEAARQTDGLPFTSDGQHEKAPAGRPGPESASHNLGKEGEAS